MRGKRAKEIRRMATQQWVAAMMQQEGESANVQHRKLVRKGPQGSREWNTGINHPHSLHSLYKLMKRSYKRFTSNPCRDPRVHA